MIYSLLIFMILIVLEALDIRNYRNYRNVMNNLLTKWYITHDGDGRHD